MEFIEVSRATGLSEKALVYAAGCLAIPTDGLLGKEDLLRIHKFLKHNGGYLDIALNKLKTVAETAGPRPSRPSKPKVTFLGGGKGFDPGFLLMRQNLTGVKLERQSRNCGDTADLVVKGLTGVISLERDITLKVFVDAISRPPKTHELWQVTVHQHTFTLERHPGLGNRLVQSYQSNKGTYNVQFWCGLDEAFIDPSASGVCGALPKDWFKPKDAQLVELAKLISLLYSVDVKERAGVWAQLPFHPGDIGKLLQTEEMAFAAERRALSNADFPASVSAVIKSLAAQ